MLQSRIKHTFIKHMFGFHLISLFIVVNCPFTGSIGANRLYQKHYTVNSNAQEIALGDRVT